MDRSNALAVWKSIFRHLHKGWGASSSWDYPTLYATYPDVAVVVREAITLARG